MGSWQFVVVAVMQFLVSWCTPLMHSVRDEPLLFHLCAEIFLAFDFGTTLINEGHGEYQ